MEEGILIDQDYSQGFVNYNGDGNGYGNGYGDGYGNGYGNGW
jgi:hypothetical protein